MKITTLTSEEKNRVLWNAFVVKEFPPVGAFLQSYEWGDFKEALHGKVLRFVIEDESTKDGEWLACFQLELHRVPLGFCYGYVPRGPVLKKEFWNNAEKVAEIFSFISAYLKEHFAHLIFVRFEPPCEEYFPSYKVPPFVHAESYVQPHLNQLVTIASEDALLKTFSPDIKHDIRAAARVGVMVTATAEPSAAQRAAFEEMKIDTGKRSGKNIFPSAEYFAHFLKIFHADSNAELVTGNGPRLCFFIASNTEGKPVAINLNLLYGKTLTYLYGASYSGSISKRAPAYLHWKTMEYARENGFIYYDLGGIDDSLWQGLTYFKRQFGGETLRYLGTVDAVFQPVLYKLYVKVKDSSVKNVVKRLLSPA